jgi:hypothetical protein
MRTGRQWISLLQQKRRGEHSAEECGLVRCLNMRRPPARPREDRLGSNHGHDTITRLRYAAVRNPWPMSDTRKTGEQSHGSREPPVIPRKRKTGQDSRDLRKPGTTGHAPCGPKSVPNGSSEMAYTEFLLRCSVAVKCCETPLV